MAMEYIYVEGKSKEPIPLQHFKGLRYNYYGGALEVINERGEEEAFFRVDDYTCYLLQHRNKSALQLHKVTPPFKGVERIPWLFGFNCKSHRCDDREAFKQVCEKYQAEHPDRHFYMKTIDGDGASLTYAYIWTGGCAGDFMPVAYYYRTYGRTTWAMFSKDTEYQFLAEMHDVLGAFKYPLQYVIRVFQAATMSYPVETRKFFHERLGYHNRKDVYYADLEGSF